MFPYEEIMGHFKIGDHPQIARVLATGYPDPVEDEECEVCGCTATVWSREYGVRCYDCMRAVFRDMDDESAAEVLGFEVIE